jgi:hypothetical protein
LASRFVSCTGLVCHRPAHPAVCITGRVGWPVDIVPGRIPLDQLAPDLVGDRLGEEGERVSHVPTAESLLSVLSVISILQQI